MGKVGSSWRHMLHDLQTISILATRRTSASMLLHHGCWKDGTPGASKEHFVELGVLAQPHSDLMNLQLMHTRER